MSPRSRSISDMRSWADARDGRSAWRGRDFSLLREGETSG